jgi:hypothetical protein
MFHFNQMAGMVPMREQFNSEPGNPLKREKISLAKHMLYKLDIHSVRAKGAKVWIRDELGFADGEKEKAGATNALNFLVRMAQAREKAGVEPDEILARYVNICPRHSSLEILKYIVKTAEENGIHILFYLTPICYDDIQAAKRFDPERFECSAKKLSDAATGPTARCVDLLKLLDTSLFIDSVHYNSQGHAEIAAALAPEVLEMLGENSDAE